MRAHSREATTAPPHLTQSMESILLPGIADDFSSQLTFWRTFKDEETEAVFQSILTEQKRRMLKKALAVCVVLAVFFMIRDLWMTVHSSATNTLFRALLLGDILLGLLFMWIVNSRGTRLKLFNEAVLFFKILAQFFSAASVYTRLNAGGGFLKACDGDELRNPYTHPSTHPYTHPSTHPYKQRKGKLFDNFDGVFIVSLFFFFFCRSCIDSELVFYGLSIGTFLSLFYIISTAIFTKFSYFLASTISLNIIYFICFAAFGDFNRVRKNTIISAMVMHLTITHTHTHTHAHTHMFAQSNKLL